jgi:hypothetical protein
MLQCVLVASILNPTATNNVAYSYIFNSKSFFGATFLKRYRRHPRLINHIDVITLREGRALP